MGYKYLRGGRGLRGRFKTIEAGWRDETGWKIL